MGRCPGQGRHLFRRIYLHGLLLFLVVGAAVSGLALVAGPTAPWQHKVDVLSSVLAADLAPRLHDPLALTAELSTLERSMGGSLAVYRSDGAELARAGGKPPEPLSGHQRALVGRKNFLHSNGARVLAVALPEGAYLLASGPELGHGRFLAAVGVLLAVVALLSIPLARSIVGPVEQLTAIAHRLANGELSARSGISRNDEVGTLARALDDMASRLEARLRGERELLANVSHEFRTPLARIRVALELCGEVEEPQALAAHLEGLALDVAELDHLVGDVLTTARLDLGADQGTRLRLERSPCDVGELAREARARFARNHPDQPLRLDVADPLPPVAAERALVLRVFDNLLENAVRYAPSGTPVDVRVTRRSGAVAVAIADHGDGVGAEELPRLFEPFYRTEQGRSRAAGGTGLGLTLCRRIVEAHGGTIEAAAPEGGGLVVMFQLPVNHAAGA